MKIAILLSTFNGERYLEGTLSSILSQCNPTSVFVRDDGSTDSTIDILSTFARDHKIHLTLGKNIGINNSYALLLESAILQGYEYFVFSDQDDQWRQRKFEVLCQTTVENPETQLFFSDAIIVNEDGIAIKYYNATLPLNEFNALFENNLMGTLCTINSNLALDLLNIIKSSNILYDKWISYFSQLNGFRYVHIREPLIEYRLHQHNHIGHKDLKNRLNTAIQYLSGYRNLEAFEMYYEALHISSKLLTNRLKLIEELNHDRQGFKQRMRLVSSFPRLRKRRADEIIIKTALVLHSAKYPSPVIRSRIIGGL